MTKLCTLVSIFCALLFTIFCALLITDYNGPQALLFSDPQDFDYKFRPILDKSGTRYVGNRPKKDGDIITVPQLLKNDFLIVAKSNSNRQDRIADSNKQIVEYTIVIYNSSADKTFTFELKSDAIPKEVKNKIKNLSPGSTIKFNSIKSVDSEGTIFKVGSLSLKIE